MTTILRTKLNLPQIRDNFIKRSSLVEKLEAADPQDLILISAPAGFGKSSLAADWLEKNPQNVGYLSLDRHDNDLSGFLDYFLAAVQEAAPGLGDDILEEIKPGNNIDQRKIVRKVFQGLQDNDENIILVLDDYHLISDLKIHHFVQQLLDHQSPLMQLVIITRVDPPFPLARLRAHNQLNEIRSEDLRFSHQEADKFLRDVFNLEISREQVNILNRRTEGWVVGLQLAGLALQNQDDIDGYINKFSGTERNVTDYLFEEVWSTLPLGKQKFLVKTSILERMSSELCRAVTARENCQSLLEDLESLNLFLVPLDHQRKWYRYHHLFSDFLQKQSDLELDLSKRELHTQAALWFSKQGYILEALHHGVAAEDHELLIDIITRKSKDLYSGYQFARLAKYIDVIPEKLIRINPHLSISRTGIAFDLGQTTLARKYLHIAEKESGKVSDIGLKIRIQLQKAKLAKLEGSELEAIQIVEEILGEIPEEEKTLNSYALLILGSSYLQAGRLNKAREVLEGSKNAGQVQNNQDPDLRFIMWLAIIDFKQGKLEKAEKKSSFVLAECDKLGISNPIITLKAYFCLGMVSFERNDLDTAANHLKKAQEKAKKEHDLINYFSTTIALGRIAAVHGKWDTVQKILTEIEQQSQRKIIGEIHGYYKALQGCLFLKTNDLTACNRWMDESGIASKEAFGYNDLWAGYVMAKLLYKNEELSEALHLSEKMTRMAYEEKALGFLIRFRILQSEIYYCLGHKERGAAYLIDAVHKAEQESYLRPFGEGEPETLERLHAFFNDGDISRHDSFLNDLFQDFPLSEAEDDDPEKHAHRFREQEELLTSREKDVLQEIASGRTRKRAAQELRISPHTVHTHMKNIYNKLGVHNRVQALVEARKKGVLEQSEISAE